jgi:Calcium-activated BK potassium channel alpha subunit
MKLAKLESNKIFILCNQYSADSNKDDTFALLATKSIHEYDHGSKIFVQLVDPEFLLHSWADWDVVMSTQAYKMGIIASNVFNPGFSTFLGNLCTSTSVSDTIKQKWPAWMVQYCNGLSQEFYLVSFQRDVGKKYIGKYFSQIVE